MTNPIILTLSALLLTLFGEAPITIWSGLIEDLFVNFLGVVM